jgi:hypothetical protein
MLYHVKHVKCKFYHISTIDLLLLTDYDKRQTHPLVREGAVPKTRQKLSNSN